MAKRWVQEHARPMSDLIRPKSGRVVGGVCAALARRFNLSPTVVRLIFILSCLLPGPQFIIYIALWIIVPSEK
jgi:phage shock protein PspC (stress-responsive transcriptional regulator)